MSQVTTASHREEQIRSTAFPLPLLSQDITLPKTINLSAMRSVPHLRPKFVQRRNAKRRARIMELAGLVFRSLMGLLASIFAYLSAIAAIIVFFVMAADALLYHPHHRAANPRPELITAAAKVDPHKPNKAAQPPQRNEGVGGIAQSRAAAEYRRRTGLSNTRFEDRRRRALGREQQAGYWQRRRERAPAPLALGYAEQPAPQFGDEPRR